MKYLATIAFCAILALTTVTSAHAGCPNLCDITVGRVVVVPQLPQCARVNGGYDDCVCSVEIVLWNSCTTAIESLDASFCQNKDCPSAEPDGDGHWLVKAITSTGHHEWSVRLRTADGVIHTATVEADVTSMGGGCGCGIPPARDITGIGLVTAGLSFLVLGWLRVARRKI